MSGLGLGVASSVVESSDMVVVVVNVSLVNSSRTFGPAQKHVEIYS